MVSPTPIRWTLDIAHLAGDSIIRRHIVRLSFKDVQVIEAHEQSQPGKVFIERSRHVLGDTDWSIEYRNPDIPLPEGLTA